MIASCELTAEQVLQEALKGTHREGNSWFERGNFILGLGSASGCGEKGISEVGGRDWNRPQPKGTT